MTRADLVRIALGALLAAACSDRGEPAPRDPAPGSAQPAPPPPAAPPAAPPEPAPTPDDATGADLPAACQAYKALALRLAACEALGAQRDLLAQQFESSWQAWTALADRTNIAAQCETAAEALRRAAAAPCGW